MSPLTKLHAKLKKKHLDKWVGGWVRYTAQRKLTRQETIGPRHLLFAFCDHYEPLWHDASIEHGRERVRATCSKPPVTTWRCWNGRAAWSSSGWTRCWTGFTWICRATARPRRGGRQ